MIEARELFVSLSLIDLPENPSRATIDPERVGALADDIAAQGLLQRPGVSGPYPDGRYRLVFGHRRLLACRLLSWAELPVKCWPAGTDTAQMQVSENNVREPLTPLEEARELRRAVERGEPVAALARLWRRSSHWVDERLSLLELPADLQAAAHDKTLPLTVVRALADVDHADYRASLIAEATRTGANGRTVEVWVAHYRADRDRIVQNHMTVQEIAAGRESWKLMVPCELCEELTEYTRTRGLRGCVTCLDALAELIDQKAREAVAEAERASR